MRRLLLVALPAGLAILGAAVLLSSLRSRSETFEARLERARVKREFAERAALSRALPADKLPEWQAEVAALSRWYFEALAAVRGRFPGATPAPAPVEDEKASASAKSRAAVQDFQRYADGRLALLREGAYAPVRSASADGLRLDLLALEPGASPDGGGPGLRIDFALWGAPRLLERERTGDKTVTRALLPVAFKRLTLRFQDAAGKPWGEMGGAGEPYQKLVDAERFADDFPPGILFGTWWVELFPREAATVSFELEADVRGASGAIRPATFQASLPVPEAWKLPPGAAFQGELREAAPAR